jgi:hypothetical protein
MDKKDIGPINSMGEWHGHQEWYDIKGKIWFIGRYKNGEPINYNAWYPRDEHEKGCVLFFIK